MTAVLPNFHHFTNLSGVAFNGNYVTRILNGFKHLHSKPKMKTAGIIVIGDEILKGQIHDTNSFFAMKTFYGLGIKVQKVSILADITDEIAQEVQMFSQKYDYVLTSGGIGPTHDDVTFEAVAQAFNVKLHAHPLLVKICSKFYQTDALNAPGMKLAFIPENAKLTFGIDPKTGQKINYPNISIQNVYLFPGIPQLFQKSLDILATKLFQSDSKFYCHNIYLNINEQWVVSALEKVVTKYPEVTFGSYPDLNNDTYKVKLTVESTDKSLSERATSDLLHSFEEGDVVGKDLSE